MQRAGYTVAHWNFAAIGLPTLADGLPDAAFAEVRAAFDAAGLAIPSASATYNAIGPDTERRAAETRQAAELIRRTRLLGAEAVTLCTGTRDPNDMWHAHPDNASAAAWRDLRATLDVLLDAASEGGVVLGIEPEPGNVVRDAAAAARLLDELGDDAPIGIVFDPANLLTPQAIEFQGEILTEAVELLGPRIVSVQAKDFGLMDYHLVFRLLERVPPVPLIVQDVAEGDADRVRRDLLRWHKDVDVEVEIEVDAEVEVEVEVEGEGAR
ncbi:sugar phosphate isomerase/epimerase family protein [Actinospica sp.]|uniref:sugar phosphate isomerase/epimerase family protein n=1 Tax=Actinospica sp. TaxID=1872142 RepID=UPI002C7FB1F7|nr:TIM barrel protein [Actinospica sp.]HWG24864.1 TIM barrel protein [Actinospica sp.]